MVSVGITGGIGSGKTTVCKVWEALGAYILNADDLAKKVMVENEEVKRQIIDTFGEESYHQDGTLNRSFLSEQAFARNRVDELNAIVHPKLPEECKKESEKAESAGFKVFVYEAALLMQNLDPGFWDYIVLVLADPSIRIERVRNRDEVEEQKVFERMNKQQVFSNLKHLADIVIENNGTLRELEEKAKQVYYLLQKRSETKRR